jgi:FtsH-binding integral membrane protein
LFWEQPFGINFFIFVVFATLGGLIPIWMEKIRVPWISYFLLIPIAFFGVMTFIRAEPLTTSMNTLLTLSALILFAMTLRSGHWYQYRLLDYIVNGIHFILNMFAGGILFFTKTKKMTDDQASGETLDEERSAEEEVNNSKTPKISRLKELAPYLRGILLTLPILAILAFFLGQADPIFSDRLQGLFSRFSFENLGDTLFRMVYIVIIAYALLSTYTFALVDSGKTNSDEKDQAGISPFLGSIESNMVLGGVNLLFLAFVILQFNYLFSGGRNISLAGYTYAEYARRGFFELIAVALISLVLFYTLSLVTKREERSQGRLFTILGLVLVGLVAIILVSAHIRLSLYEMAYGFTRLRTQSHIFIIWIGLLLVALAYLELSKKITRLAFVLVCFLIGFGLTVNLINIDRFIVNQNVSRAFLSTETQDADEATDLDASYLSYLSADAVPQLTRFFKDSQTPETVRDDLGGVLACMIASRDESDARSWMSYHFAYQRADTLLDSLSEDLEDYPVTYDMYLWYVEINGEEIPCGLIEND